MKWADVESFRKVQQGWAWAALISFVLIVIMIIMSVFVFAFFSLLFHDSPS